VVQVMLRSSDNKWMRVNRDAMKKFSKLVYEMHPSDPGGAFAQGRFCFVLFDRAERNL
jgi:hypothetical protein